MKIHTLILLAASLLAAPLGLEAQYGGTLLGNTTLSGNATFTIPATATLTVATDATFTIPPASLPIGATDGLQAQLDNKANAIDLGSAAYTNIGNQPGEVPGVDDFGRVNLVGGLIAPSATLTTLFTGQLKQSSNAPTLGVPFGQSGDTLAVLRDISSAIERPAGALLTGNATGPLGSIAPGTSGHVLTSNGTAWLAAAPSGGGGGNITINTTAPLTINGGSTATTSNATLAISAATTTTAGSVPGLGTGDPFAPTLTNAASVGQMRGAGRSRSTELFADFFGLGDLGGFTSDGSGTGSGVSFVVADHAAGIVGVYAISTGTTTTGRGLITNGTTSQGPRLDDGQTYYEAKVRIPVLSDSTDAFTVFCGGRGSGTSADTGGNDANGFRYTHSTNGGRWLAVSRVSTNETSADTGVAPTANVFQVLGILINATGTSAGYYIDGVLVATITSNIQVIGRGRPQHGLLKSAGTNARTLDLDYVYIRKEFTAPR